MISEYHPQISMNPSSSTGPYAGMRLDTQLINIAEKPLKAFGKMDLLSYHMRPLAYISVSFGSIDRNFGIQP